MIKPFIIKNITTIDVSIIEETLLNNEWNDYDFRQIKYNMTHHNTKTIPIYWLSNKWKVNTIPNINIFYQFIHYKNWIDNEIYPLLNSFYPNCIIVKAMFAMLLPNSNIPEHIDKGDSLKYVHRIHIPIITNENVLFFIDNTEFNFKKGEIIEINNMKKHRVENNSSDSRIHLIIDLLNINMLPINTIPNYIDIYNIILDNFIL